MRNVLILLVALFVFGCVDKSNPVAPVVIIPPAADSVITVNQFSMGKINYTVHRACKVYLRCVPSWSDSNYFVDYVYHHTYTASDTGLIFGTVTVPPESLLFVAGSGNITHLFQIAGAYTYVYTAFWREDSMGTDWNKIKEWNF